MKNSVSVLGTRGSVPVSGPAFSHYGGATTCFLVHLAGQYLLLDAGTGILHLPEEVLSVRTLPLILTHTHLDHLIGLPMCPYLFHPGVRLLLYSQPFCELSGEALFDQVFSPPFWPVTLDSFPAKVSFLPLTEKFQVGNILVETLPGIHPDGVALLRLTGDGKRVVLATDCTVSSEIAPLLKEFAQNCDLLLCDGQYSPEEWDFHKTFGHSTWISAAKLGLDCHAKQVRVIHHSPFHSDAVLDAALPSLQSIHPKCFFAYEMEEILL